MRSNSAPSLSGLYADAVAYAPLGGDLNVPPSRAVAPFSGRWSALRSLVVSALASVVALAAVFASAQSTLYWDTNGTADGSGAATGTWGAGSSLWNTDSTGGAGGSFTDATTSADNLFISAGTNGTTGTITVSGTQSANSLTFRNNVPITVSGGTSINLGSTTGAGLFLTSGVNNSNTVSTPLVLGSNVTFGNFGGIAGSNPSLTVGGGITGTGNIAIDNSGVGSSISFGATTLNNAGSISYAGSSYAAQSLPLTGTNVTGVTQAATGYSLKMASAFTVGSAGTTLTKTGLQNFYFYNVSLTGTGNLVFNNNSAYANPNGLDIYGQGGGAVVNNVGSLTNSGTGVGGTRIYAQIGTNVTSVTQNSATSTLYLMNFGTTPGAGNGTAASNAYTGPTNINAGILYSGYAAALNSTSSIVFGGGTLMYGGNATDLSAKLVNNGVANYRVDTNGQSVTFATALAANGSTGLDKYGSGTLTLGGANTYVGTTTIGGGTGTLEKLGGGTLAVTGSLNGTTGTDLQFNGTGAFTYTGNMKQLTFNAGDGTLSSASTFASLAPRGPGATGNFNAGTTLTSTTNAPPASGSNDQGLFFNSADYTRYDAGTNQFRAIAYGTDANAPAAIGAGTTLGVNGATQDVQINGSISAQTSAAVNTLKISNASNMVIAPSSTLAVNGILKTGAATLGSFSGSTISGGTGSALTVASPNADFVVRTDSGNPDAVTISVPLVANGTNNLVKSGAGWLKVSGSNGLTGNIAINQGTLQLDTPTDKTYGGVISGAGNLFVSGPGVLTLNGPATTFTGDLWLNNGTLKLDFSAAGAPSADMINAGTRIVFGAGGGQTNVSGGGTLLIKGKSSGVTSQNLGINVANVVTAGVNNQPGSSRLFVDPNGGSATNVTFGKIGNVLANADSSTGQNTATNGSGLLIGKSAGAGSGAVNFLFNTDGRNGPSNGTFLCGRLVYTDNGGSNVDFVTTSQQESGVYSIIPVQPIGTTGAQYTYSPVNGSGGSTSYFRFDNAMSSQTGVTTLGQGLKIENPGAGKSITINSTSTVSPQGGIIMTGTDDFSILSGNIGVSNNGNGRAYIFQQYSTGTLTVSSVLNDTNAATDFIKLGPGRLIMAGANVYARNTYISEGILQAGIAQNGTTSGPFGKSSSAGSIIFAGGTLQYSAANQQDYSPRFRTGDGEPIRIDTNGQSVAFAAALTSSRGTLTKLGSGMLTLNAAGNTYSGDTVISGGTLALGTSGQIPFSPTISIGAGSIFDVTSKLSTGLTVSQFTPQELRGDGTAYGNFTLGTGSTLTPGTSGVGTLSFDGNLTLSATSLFRFELGSDSTAGTTYDQVKLLSSFGGTFDVGAGVVNFTNFAFTPLTGFGPGTYTLFDGGFATTPAGSLGSSLTGQINGFDATLSQSGSNILLTVTSAVPEPGTVVLLAAAGLVVAAGFRRRSR